MKQRTNISFFNDSQKISRTVSIKQSQKEEKKPTKQNQFLFYMPQIKTRNNSLNNNESNSQYQNSYLHNQSLKINQKISKKKQIEVDHHWMNYDHLIRDLQRINFYSTNKNKLQIKQHDINENQKETPSHSILKSQRINKPSDKKQISEFILNKGSQFKMSDRNKEVDFDIKIENTSSNERISVNTIQEKEMISEIDIIKHKMDHFDLQINQLTFQLQSILQIEKEMIYQLSLKTPADNELWQQVIDLQQ